MYGYRQEKIDVGHYWGLSCNSPYACLRQTSKFHHQVSFSKYKVAKFCINEFPGQYSWKEYPRIKSANAKNFAFKRGLVVKFFSSDAITHKGHYNQGIRESRSSI